MNAYGQREEGPSRWQERKEAKRQMYLMSTERAVKLGVRKKSDPKSMGGCHVANEVGGGLHKVCGPIMGTSALQTILAFGLVSEVYLAINNHESPRLSF